MEQHFDIEKLSFDWDQDRIPYRKPLRNVTVEGKPLIDTISNLLQNTQWIILNPLRPGQIRIALPQEVLSICDEVFPVIKTLKQDNKNTIAAYLASRLFEGFSSYFQGALLPHGQHILGIKLWHFIIDYAKKWEDENKPITVHKGTPYYFLGVNYYLLGDLDNAFVFFYNAIEDDKKLPELGYPKTAPIYQTITLADEQHNHMYSYIVKPLRDILTSYVNKFQTDFDHNFNIQEIDRKFLQNKDLEDLSYFFVYNFMNFHDINNEFKEDVRINEFSKLKALDQFFNLVLVVDQLLKYASNNSLRETNMYSLIKWWAGQAHQIAGADLDNLIGRNNLNLNESTPQDVVQNLLDYIQNPTCNMPKEIFVMLLAYHLRNYAGHNIERHDVLISKYNEIREKLFMAIFLAVKSINV